MFTIVCNDGLLEVEEKILAKIPHFQSIINGDYKESQEKIIELNTSTFACQTLFNFLQGQINHPLTLTGIEECLALGDYLNLDYFCQVLSKKYLLQHQHDKHSWVDLLRLYHFVGTDWIKKVSHNFSSMPRLHMLEEKILREIIKFCQNPFPILREWTLITGKNIDDLFEKYSISQEDLKPYYRTRMLVKINPRVGQLVALAFLSF